MGWEEDDQNTLYEILNKNILKNGDVSKILLVGVERRTAHQGASMISGTLA